MCQISLNLHQLFSDYIPLHARCGTRGAGKDGTGLNWHNSARPIYVRSEVV